MLQKPFVSVGVFYDDDNLDADGQAGEMLYDIWDVNEDAEYPEAGDSGAEEALKSARTVPRRIRSAA
jgi:hypothetical protein